MEWKTVTSTERDIESHIRIKERVACDHLFNVQALYDISLKDIVRGRSEFCVSQIVLDI